MPLAPRVFLAFNDFARAGPHALRFARVAGADAAAARALPLPLPPAFARHVHAWDFAAEPAVSFVVVDSAAVEKTAYWALADALLTLLGDAGVQELTVVAALHLPYAKAAAGGVTAPVFHAELNADSGDGDGDDALPALGARFPPVDAAWELKDRFLAALVHLLKVEQAPRAHFLLAKSYKPGRDHAGTYEAVDALASAIATFSDGRVAFDALEIKTALPRRLADTVVDVNAARESEHHTLLYH